MIYYRELSNTYRQLDLESEFWTHTIDAHVLQATIYWCMVFGSDSQPLHWKKLSESKEIQESFRQGLLNEINLTPEEWNHYWKSMNDFRNEVAAHHIIDFDGILPNLDVAKSVAYYYDDWVRDLVSGSFSEPSLKTSANRLKQSVPSLINQLLEQTKIFNQSSYEV